MWVHKTWEVWIFCKVAQKTVGRFQFEIRHLIQFTHLVLWEFQSVSSVTSRQMTEGGRSSKVDWVKDPRVSSTRTGRSMRRVLVPAHPIIGWDSRRLRPSQPGKIKNWGSNSRTGMEKEDLPTTTIFLFLEPRIFIDSQWEGLQAGMREIHW